ncbi:inner centromere protein [Pisolithus marmoratus]|nr:inner centromere protein [Pisolithus marmoratus]
MTSATSSSQSETGFFGQATKLVTSMLGGGKKDKPEIKSLQRAAATAKRQQDEADKKALRLREMEARRQAILARKAEEEKARILEDDKKTKEDSERRKREREENADKRPMKLPTVAAKKLEDDSTKKRKLAVETQKKVEAKKLLSKDKKDPVPFKLVKPSVPTPTAKSVLPPKSVRCVASALVSSAAYNASQNLPGKSSGSKPAIPEAKPFKLAPVHKDKVKAIANDASDKLPSAMIQTQMAARAKAQIEASKQQVPEVPSESIELPDINSEYSDSEDEDRVRTFDPPDWAQSPELRQALQIQSTVNPDDIFGAIRPLRMEEMFRTRQSRFRARTSSANWSGADRLTIEEIREYERRMGFRSQAQ